MRPSIIKTPLWFAAAMFIHLHFGIGGVNAGTGGRLPKHEIGLSGQMTGGELLLIHPSSQVSGGYQCSNVRIRTTAGEPVEAVVRRLVAATSNCWSGVGFRLTNQVSYITGLEGLRGFYALAGTEMNVGIPESPMFLSGSYDSNKNRVVLRWENPSRGYDALSNCRLYQMLSSNETTTLEGGDGPYTIVGIRGGVPSGVAVINVTGNVQEELASMPFSGGIAPNWCSWASHAARLGYAFGEGARVGHNKSWRQATPDGKLYYQIVKTKTADVTAGIWRKWLGLVPEHKYRVYVRLNTLAMDQNTNDWSLSFHVAPTDAKGTDFTTDQFTGKAPLPDGSQGPEAARIALYGPGKTTKGLWVTNTVEIVMPPGVDTLTTWLRHSGKDSTGVGMDWIKVEDLSYKPSTNTPTSHPRAPASGLEGF